MVARPLIAGADRPMFTGIIHTMGTVRTVRHGRASSLLTIAARLAGGALRPGESIAVDGVCLTVETAGPGWFRVRAAPETLRRTTLGGLRVGGRVNLERSLRPSDRMGGHFVFGHVDGLAVLRSITPEGDSRLYRFTAPARLMHYLVEKGSVALNGVSLTVFGCAARSFTVCLVPYTLQHTNLGSLRPGGRLNLETDMLARYVEGAVGAALQHQPRPPSKNRRRPPARATARGHQ